MDGGRHVAPLPETLGSPAADRQHPGVAAPEVRHKMLALDTGQQDGHDHGARPELDQAAPPVA
eukprot:4131208-Lingulodinium_polyedra.AAC.1